MLQRELTLSTATQLAGRAVFATVALAAFVFVSMRGDAWRAFRTMGWAGLAFAASTGIASGSFIVALNHTSVANVLFLQAASPIAAALLARITLGEPISRRAWGAMLVALCGVGIMLGGPGGGEYLGFGVSLVMTVAFAVSIVISRHRRDISMAPATCLSQVLVFAVAAPFATPSEIGPHDLVLLIVLGFGQMGLGLALFTVGARLLPAAEIALITLLEIVLGPLWVWIVISEHPSATTVAGGAVVIAAVVLQTTGDGTSRSPVPH